MQPLKIQLFPKKDTDGQVFYIGKLRFPGTINLGKGVVCFVYLDDDINELHICPSELVRIEDPATYLNKARRKASRSRHNNISIELSPYLSEDRKCFIGSINSKLIVSADDGLVFLIFVADKNEEEMQISSQGNNKKKNSFGS